MKHYTEKHGHYNTILATPFGVTVNRLAIRLSRELGISIDHATAAVAANNACKEKRDE